MTVKKFQKQTKNLLSDHRNIHYECNDTYANKYLATHSDIELAQDLLSVTQNHPLFFLYFMLFTKLKELDIIDQGMFYHIMDNVIYREPELDEFITELLSHYAIKK